MKLKKQFTKGASRTVCVSVGFVEQEGHVVVGHMTGVEPLQLAQRRVMGHEEGQGFDLQGGRGGIRQRPRKKKKSQPRFSAPRSSLCEPSGARPSAPQHPPIRTIIRLQPSHRNASVRSLLCTPGLAWAIENIGKKVGGGKKKINETLNLTECHGVGIDVATEKRRTLQSQFHPRLKSQKLTRPSLSAPPCSVFTF